MLYCTNKQIVARLNKKIEQKMIKMDKYNRKMNI